MYSITEMVVSHFGMTFSPDAPVWREPSRFLRKYTKVQKGSSVGPFAVCRRFGCFHGPLGLEISLAE